jgi:hypothetical protein
MKEMAEELIEKVISGNHEKDSINIKKDMVEGGKKKYGKLEKDTLPKKDVVIKSDFPDVIKDTVYKAGKVTTFETADRNSLLRSYENSFIRKALFRKYPNYFQSFIFDSKEFNGSIVEYIVEKEEIEIEDVIKNSKVEDELSRIPKFIRNKSSVKPEQDKWY